MPNRVSANRFVTSRRKARSDAPGPAERDNLTHPESSAGGLITRTNTKQPGQIRAPARKEDGIGCHAGRWYGPAEISGSDTRTARGTTSEVNRAPSRARTGHDGDVTEQRDVGDRRDDDPPPEPTGVGEPEPTTEARKPDRKDARQLHPPAVPLSHRMRVPHISPEVIRSAARAQRQAAEALRFAGPHLAAQEKLARSLAPVVQAYSEQLRESRSVETYRSMQESLATSLAPVFEAARQFRLPEGLRDTMAAIGRAVADALAPNWPPEAHWSDVLDLIQETGWALVWLPDAGIMVELLASENAEGRNRVLLEHAGEITETARTRLAEVEDPTLVYLADCAREAAEAFDAGYERSSQALCASALTGLVQSVMGYDKLAKARDELAENWDEMNLPLLRYGLIVSTVPSALVQFGDVVPDRFNRHAVSHSPSPVQFTRLNALVALMLVTALVRELDEIARRGLSLLDEAE